jgi:[ribosomal protein S5]-alanine N-acetyltransferase
MLDISLKPLTAKDVTNEYVSWLNNKQIRRYLGIRHKKELITISETINFIDDCNTKGRFHWGIFIGVNHVGNVSCSAWSPSDKWIDISYLVGDFSCQGKGIATFAVGAAMKYLFEDKKYNRIQAECAIENVPSRKVMQKLGMKEEGILRQKLFLPEENKFTDEIVYSAIKESWTVPFQGIEDINVLPMIWECL